MVQLPRLCISEMNAAWRQEQAACFNGAIGHAVKPVRSRAAGTRSASACYQSNTGSSATDAQSKRSWACTTAASATVDGRRSPGCPRGSIHGQQQLPAGKRNLAAELESIAVKNSPENRVSRPLHTPSTQRKQPEQVGKIGEYVCYLSINNV